MRDPKLAHILVKIILPPNTAVSEYRRSFSRTVVFGGTTVVYRKIIVIMK